MPKTRRKRVPVSTRRKAKTPIKPASESKASEEVSSTSAPVIQDCIDTEHLSEVAALLLTRLKEDDLEAMKLAGNFRDLCSKHANASNAAAMRQYMRNKFNFFGIKSPERRRLQKEFTSEHREKLEKRQFLLEFGMALWQQDERECQLYAVDLLSDYRREVLGDSNEEFESATALAEILITHKSWWDTVDMLASHLVGYIVRERRERGSDLMEQWISHPYMWLRRSALLHQLSFKKDTEQAQLFRFCLTVANEEEFFIRKAIGWALRQYSRTDSAAVRDFVKKNREKLSKLSVSEASKYI